MKHLYSLLGRAAAIALLAVVIFAAPGFLAGMAGQHWGEAYAIEFALANGPQSDGGALGQTDTPMTVEGTPVTLPTNPSQSPASFALGQSAILCYSTTQSPSAVNANTTAAQAFTVTGVAAGSLVYLSKPAVQAGLLLDSARVSAANTIQATFSNVTGGNITPTASEAYLVVEVRGPLIQTQAVTFASAVASLSTLEYSVTCTPAAGQQGLSSAQYASLSAVGLPVVPNPSGVAVPSLPLVYPSAVGSSTQEAATQGAATPVLAGAPQTVLVNKLTDQAGLGMFNARLGGNNILCLTFVNTSGAPITPTNETYSFFACRGVSLHGTVEYLVNVGALGAAAGTDVTTYNLTLNGVAAGDRVAYINKPTDQAHLGGFTGRVSAANTVVLSVVDPNAAGVTPTASEVWAIGIVKNNTGFGGVLTQFTFTAAPVAVAAITSAEQIFACPTSNGLTIKSASFIAGCNVYSGNGFTGSLGSALVTGLVVGGARVSSDGNVALNLGNVTAAQLTAAQIGSLMVTILVAPTGISGSAASSAGSGVSYPMDVQDQQQQEAVYEASLASIARGVMKGS